MSKILFAVACKFGRGGFGATSGSISVEFAEKTLSEERRHLFIGSSLDVTLSLNPEPNTPVLDGMQEVWNSIGLQVKTNTISINERSVSSTLKFEKGDMPGEFLKEISGQNGSIIVRERIEEATPAAAAADEDDEDDDEDDDA